MSCSLWKCHSRLALFLQVCNAVQHAHQKGIIHRDIKPSNVMVTHHDAKPVPKVIDFGIAKATNQKLTEKTLFTRYAHIVGTPAYMSPEQAELSDLDIDTRSDIYSLGVLLYELLTGTTPFSEDELRKAGYMEMQRIIREQEPAKPSTRLTTLGETLTDVAKHRNSTPDLLRKAICGDLDWIVMKSLEKDRTHRYEGANALAEDIRRHLEHEPVLARGPGITYRLGKFLRKHRAQVVAALGIIVVVGVVVTILSMWNRDRLQLAEAERFRHRGILSQAREQYAKADREAALETIRPILQSKHVGPEAQLLQAGILVDNRRSDEAVTMLGGLLNNRPEIAGAAHSLLARILWESESPNAEKLKEIEEHRRQAEALLPETADAYFLRAMTAVTIKEQLASLDRALKLDPSHYEARRLQVFTYYASRKYDRMREEALAMTILRPRDPLGHSLRAIALRESGRYGEAIMEYDEAIALTLKESPESIDLSIQRSETLLRMGDYERVIAETPVETQNLASLQYHLFCALTALGEYDKAAALFRQIIASSHEARQKLQDWCAKYVFDTLGAGRSWHPPDREPVGAAFLPMVEAEETYHDLSAKGRRVTTDGFSTRWSPDGKKLAFSMGVHGYSGVAIFDPSTKETDLLIVPGKDPRWSPDGQYIAFVRDCRFLRVSEFIAAERRNQHRLFADEEVWVMKSDGTEPRRLARGGWPSWSRDSTRIYYHSRVDNTLCSISIVGRDAKPNQIMTCAHSFPSVSPDNQRVAYLEGTSLKIKDLASQTLVAERPVPFAAWGGAAWSPTGRELCLAGRSNSEDRTGLWIYSLDRSEPARTLGGQITVGSWAPDGTKLVFCLGPPYFEMWAADLDPNVSTIEALGPGRTPDEHFREMVALYTRRIETDPADADNYVRRAEQCRYLRQEAKARADVRRYYAILSQRVSMDSRLSGAWTLMRSVKGPSGHQFVVFVERQEDGIHVLRVAFGQKGRCNMKLFEVPLFVTSLVGLCFLSGLDAPTVRADYVIGTPTNLGPNINTAVGEVGPSISVDGLSLYFTSENGYGGRGDIWVATRATIDGEWGQSTNLGSVVNSSACETCPSISADGLTLFFCDGYWGVSAPQRPGGYGDVDLWVTTRRARDAEWTQPVNLGPAINSPYWDGEPAISSDGLSLYFASNRPGGYGSSDIYVATRATTRDEWGPPINLGPSVNSASTEGDPSISADGLTLFVSASRPGTFGSFDLWMTQRRTQHDDWVPLVNLGPAVNTAGIDWGPEIAPDNSTFYFCTARSGGIGYYDLWQTQITPIVDFNGDGKVDAADMALLEANWGKNKPLCDIGPFAWGDGMVDERDLKVLMESLMTPGPHASDVPCDTILSWISPSFASTCDVYFGTSFEAVNNADRADPCGVLVSQGQTTTTYEPNGLLEFGRTCYWRIDFVVPDPTPTIYKGPVMEFTTEPFARPIKNIIAKSSSAAPGSGPERMIDGSGLDKNGGHSTNATDMWLSTGSLPNWIYFEFDKVYTLQEMWVWNSNWTIEPLMGFGAKSVKIEYSTDSTTWTALEGVPEFAQAPGKAGYVANTIVSFGGVSAQHVKLTIEKGWGATPSVGLSEVRFFHIPDRPPTEP